MSSQNLKIKFQPRQVAAFCTPATELLFGGASEGGKSAFVRRAASIWSDLIPGLITYIFREHYSEVMENHMHGKDGFISLLKPWTDSRKVVIADNKIKFANSSRIILAQLKLLKDLEKYQGLEKHVLFIDEAPSLKPEYIDGLRGWVRMPLDMKQALPNQIRCLYPWMTDDELMEMFPRIIYTGNPKGPAKVFFRRQFVYELPNEEIRKVGAFTRQFLPSYVSDNKYADPEAQRERLKSAFGEEMATSLIIGSWEQLTGAYYPEFDSRKHIVDNFLPPKGWFTFRTFDWGSSEPFAVLWWCVSDGTEFKDHKGRTRWFPKGALVAYREWYGCDPDKPHKGLRMRNEDVAQGIITRTTEEHTGITVSDSLPFQDRGMSKNSQEYKIADVFAEYGCPLVLGNCARIHGWSKMRDRLIGVDGLPMIYWTHDCKHSAEYIPSLERHPSKEEDAQESGEPTHICDICRLACTTKPFVMPQAEEEKKQYTTISKENMAGYSMTPKQILQGIKYGNITGH